MEVYFNLSIRVIITFIALMLVVRLQGKKQIAQFSYFNYINGIAVGSLAANVVFVHETPLATGLFQVILWSAITWLVAFLSLKSLTLRRWFEGVPRYMIKDGHIVEENLRKENLTLEDLTSMLRQKNNFAIADVELAILELDGNLSVQSRSDTQLVTRGDLNLHDKKYGIALPLIVDGVILEENLKANKLSIEWLKQQLQHHAANLEEVLYMELGVEGDMKIEKKK